MKPTTKDLLIILAFVIFLALFYYNTRNFVFEDAYITYRYAQHIGQGYGFVFNIGEDPVQGSTTVLWPLILAFFYKMGFVIEEIAKLLNLFFAILTVTAVYFFSRSHFKNGILTSFIISFPLTIVYAVHIATGMETVLFGFLITLATMLSIKLIGGNGNLKTELCTCLSFFLVVVTRPEGIIFSTIMFLSIMTYWWFKKKKFYRRFLISGLAIFIVPTIVYYLSSLLYFGYILPNTFYVKKSIGVLSMASLKNVYYFLSYCVVPYLMITIVWLLNIENKKISSYLAMYMPIAFFIAAHLTITPSMDVGFRYLMPLLPSILILSSKPIDDYVSVHANELLKMKNYLIFKKFVKNFVLIICILILLFWPSPILKFSMDYTLDDRNIVGKELNKFAGKGYTMMTTESGMIPYYSEWRTIDTGAFNDEYIAHNGLTEEYIRSNDPQIIMFHTFTDRVEIMESYNDTSWNIMTRNLHLYAKNNGYTLAAMMPLTYYMPYHYDWYYVKNDFEDSKEIIGIFKNIENEAAQMMRKI